MRKTEGGRLAKKRGISDTKLALINLLQKEKFRAVPPSERVLFLPHCLRKPKGCRGETTEEGLVCKHCSPDCSINQLTTYAASKGYRCFVVPGGEMVFNLVEKHRPKAILGVACHHEMAQAADRIGSKESSISFAYQGVPLTKTGCVDTKVDIAAVKAVLDMEPSPTPVKIERSPAAASPRRFPWRAGAYFAASMVIVLAALLLIPPLLGPALAPARTGQPELSFSKPTATYYTDTEGNPMAEVKVAVHNNGPGAVRGVLIRATALYCAGVYSPTDGGVRELLIDRAIPKDGHEDLSIAVRVHSFNDTAILIEEIIRGSAVTIGRIDPVKLVFIRNVDVTGYSTVLPGGRQANVSVEVFNAGDIRPAGSLRLVVTSFTSSNIQRDSKDTTRSTPLTRNETWSTTVPVDVVISDPGKPSFVVELYENGGTAPTDTMTVDG